MFFQFNIFLIIFIFLLALYYSSKFKKRIIQTQNKLDFISSLLVSLHPNNKYETIKKGFYFITQLKELYQKYKPFYITVNSLTWDDKIQNFKLNNIIKIDGNEDPFDVIPNLQNYPVSNYCWINEMLMDKCKFRYIEFTEDSKYKTAFPDLKCAYVFFKYEGNIPIFVYIMSYAEIIFISELELEEIHKNIVNYYG